MARIIYCHPHVTQYPYHIYTDLDFWDARRILMGLAEVRRNFGTNVDGDIFPTQVILDGSNRSVMARVERRLKKAIISPPRHVVVRSMIFDGFFEFDPLDYYPSRWSKEKMSRFTFRRLPLDQSSLCNDYQTVQLSWNGEKLRVEKVQRESKQETHIRTEKEAQKRLQVPSCF